MSDRAKQYRKRADECRAEADKTNDLILLSRPGLIQLAQLCEILADSIEAGLGNDSPSDSN